MMNSPFSAEVRYELSITADEAVRGTTKLLVRNGKRLQVVVPPGVTDGSQVKLNNARQNTDGQPGDILIQIKIKEQSGAQSGNPPAEVIEISDADFSKEVLQSQLPVLVDFWAPWCGPCRMMGPVIAQAAQKYQGKFKFCKLNVDENPQSAARYQAMSIPLLLFFKDGQVIEKSLGAIPANRLYSILDNMIVGI
jgi:thioredoxin 1